jgi:hypothetical protein
MTELVVEATSELPWAGGWLIRLEPPGGENAAIEFDGSAVTARYQTRRGGIEARWSPLDPAAPSPFELRLCDDVTDSAREVRLC